MERDQRLLAIVQIQSEIALARPDRDTVLRLVAERAVGLTSAAAVAVEAPDGRTLVTAGAAIEAPAGVAHKPLAGPAGRLGVLIAVTDDPAGFTADDGETFTLLAGVLSAHLGAVPNAAGRDPLTGLDGADAYARRLEHESALHARDGRPFAVVALEFAPPADAALRIAAAVVGRWTRAVDGVYRVAPTRLALILPGTNAGAARALTARIDGHLSDAVPPGTGWSSAVVDGAGLTPGEMASAVDAALAGVAARAA